MDEDGLTSWEAPPRGESGPRPPLNLRQIEVFRAIMLSGSISGAGRMLHVSQPAVSRVLALMESRLRYPLFERSRSRLTPTAEARRLYAEVEQVYGGIQRVNELAASLGEAGAGMLRVVSSASFGQRMVPMALRALRAARANVRVDYRSATFDELPGHFLGGHADIAVSMQPPDHPNLTAVELGRSPVVCLLPREHALAARQVIRPEDFRSGAWVGYPAQTPLGTALRSFFGAAGMPPAAVEVHSPVTAAAFVQQGLGPGLVDAWCVGPELRRSVALRPIDPPAHVGIWATYSDLQPLPLMARRFLAVLRKVIASEPAPGQGDPDPRTAVTD
ncbi:LysR family transcriptional regulator [Bordetella genomosp. 9]|uniref:LysR family transcriptional regulator n=1 Tax=Bordetella genomosp. 9 TaxID=1416803 RepID=UPI000A296845|nr:LysR family transcriptional regulator [Bordetella genomosp. 9]ARP90857.1 LysR family transcriptional regulator [Bordetella genomosp. 9]